MIQMFAGLHFLKTKFSDKLL